jgi:hypothetical protein
MRIILAITAALAMFATAAAAGRTVHYVNNDLGGLLLEHTEEFAQWAHYGDRVIIDGLCASACTLLLGYSQLRVCATDSGLFAFHSASYPGGYSEGATLFMWFSYPYRVRQALLKRGWDGVSDHPEPIFIPATEIVQPCKLAPSDT